MSELLEILKVLRDIESLAATTPAPGPGAGVVGIDWRVLSVDATGTAVSSTNPTPAGAVATAATPSYVEGTTNPLSVDLSGRERILASTLGVVAPGQATPNPVGVGMNAQSGLLRNMTSALALYPDNGNLTLGVGPGVFDGSNWHGLKGNTDGSLVVGGFTPAAPTATFTRGANATPYTIGDEVGTASTAPTTISVGRFNGASGVIQGAQVVYSSYAATVPQLVVLLFSATVTLAGDNAQLNLSDAHAALCIGTIPLTASQSGQYSAGAAVAAGNTIFQGVPTAPIHFTCGASEQTIYACLITLNAFTPIANSETLIVTLSVEQN
ncbi:MAG TPA: hypothetical protein VN903_15350 [Polyangia bacterium]|nr:hypothetical protein [Polyangia bacterium]